MMTLWNNPSCPVVLLRLMPSSSRALSSLPFPQKKHVNMSLSRGMLGTFQRARGLDMLTVLELQH